MLSKRMPCRQRVQARFLPGDTPKSYCKPAPDSTSPLWDTWWPDHACTRYAAIDGQGQAQGYVHTKPWVSYWEGAQKTLECAFTAATLNCLRRGRSWKYKLLPHHRAKNTAYPTRGPATSMNSLSWVCWVLFKFWNPKEGRNIWSAKLSKILDEIYSGWRGRDDWRALPIVGSLNCKVGLQCR